MTKPNFAAMPIANLRAYVLNYRTDDETFYALADRVLITASQVCAPYLSVSK